ncbi:MAG: sulfurtransferase [Betaproteobacteria bacterium]
MHDEHLISVEALASQIDQLILIDCRSDLFDASLGKQQYESGHIPNAAFFALHDALSGPKTPGSGRHPLPDQEALVQRMQSLGANDDSMVVVYDAGSSVYAARLWWLLRWCGHDAVNVLDGGFAAWVKAGYPSSEDLSPRERKQGKGNFAIRNSLEAIIQSDELLENLGSGHHLIVDARAAERWRGDVEPLDPVAGHIPGALNRPNTQNLRPDGRFKPAEVLREEWLSLMTLQAPRIPAAASAPGGEGSALVHSCGSGVSACHNLLAMRIAGLNDDLMLHPGSWSEWCADPKRPVAKGDRP